ncbi:MAG: hypothetical protein IKD76_00410 [Clostridia bacterium]|nr:hypothetical protein [Clostridia bacterium]
MSKFAQKIKTRIAVTKKYNTNHEGFIKEDTITKTLTNRINTRKRRGRGIYAQFCVHKFFCFFVQFSYLFCNKKVK